MCAQVYCAGYALEATTPPSPSGQTAAPAMRSSRVRSSTISAKRFSSPHDAVRLLPAAAKASCDRSDKSRSNQARVVRDNTMYPTVASSARPPSKSMKNRTRRMFGEYHEMVGYETDAT